MRCRGFRINRIMGVVTFTIVDNFKIFYQPGGGESRHRKAALDGRRVDYFEGPC
jgi:hypothetical protein